MDKLDQSKLSGGYPESWQTIGSDDYADLLVAQALIYGAEWHGDMMQAKITMKSPTGRILAGHAVIHILARGEHPYMVHHRNYNEFARWVNEEYTHE